MFIKLCLCLLSIHLNFANSLVKRSDADEWGYSSNDGPSEWCKMLPESKCCGLRQSPVDITTTSATSIGNKLLLFHYKSRPKHMLLTNSGHTAMIQMSGLKNKPYLKLSNKMTFHLEQMHFHWGRHNEVGSEHTIDGQRYPLEMHFVHVNSKYESLNEALDNLDGLLVLAFFFKISDEDNVNYEKLLDHLLEIQASGSHVDTNESIAINSLLPANIFSEVFTYQGSLTTPPCSESVTWFVATHKIGISNRQMEEFRSLYKRSEPNQKFPFDRKYHLVDNYRPIQNLNGRNIYSCSAMVRS